MDEKKNLLIETLLKTGRQNFWKTELIRADQLFQENKEKDIRFALHYAEVIFQSLKNFFLIVLKSNR